MKAVLLLLSIITMGLCQDAVFNKVLLTDPGALCLDGSPGAYYIRRGSDPSKILLYFEGGGWCGHYDYPTMLQNCYRRSKGFLGSSKDYPQTRQLKGIFSKNSNKMFSQATQVLMSYCDGSGSQGYSAQPVVYKNTSLYFRGENITKAQFEDLQRTLGLFSKAKTIMITGISAGGLATFLWSNYIREKAIADNIYAFPDSGVFLDAHPIQNRRHLHLESFKNLFKLSNTETSPPVPQCVKDHKSEPQLCMFAEVLYKYIKVPLFLIQSLYDFWSIHEIAKIRCKLSGSSLKQCSQQQRDYIEEYRKNTTKVIKQIGQYSSKNGYWASSCLFHVAITNFRYDSEFWRIPMKSQNSIEASLLSWIEQKNVSHQHIDEMPWPSNKPCAGDYEQPSVENQQSFQEKTGAKVQQPKDPSIVQSKVQKQPEMKIQKKQSKTEPSPQSQVKKVQSQLPISWKFLLYFMLALVIVLIMSLIRKYRLQRLQSHQIIDEIQKIPQSDQQSIELPSESHQQQRKQTI